jgi:competence protein ComEC
VGDGACHALRSGDDAILWDCGSTWAGIGERDIPDALRALGIWRVRTLVISHPNLDHYSGALDAAHRIGLREVLTTRAFLDEAERDPLGPVAFTVDALRARGIEVRAIGAGYSVPLGSARVEFLWPAEGFASERANDESLVARVEVKTDAGARSVLMLGDIEPAGIEAMLRTSGALRADIVEAPHHGSARPGSIAFVGSLEPGVVVQSTGPQRLGDERWDGVRARALWWTTASDGAVFAEIRRDGSVVSGRSAPGRSREEAAIRPPPRSPDRPPRE